MTEELVKPAKRIHRALNSPGRFNWRKAGSILGEILIIFLAVSFSILMERWREQRHDREIEREFLQELKLNINAKMIELRDDSANFNQIYRSWRYLYKVSAHEIKGDPDSIKGAGFSLNYVLLINSNNSLFESIKTSGKLYVVEDKKLLGLIIEVFQDDIPGLIKSIDLFYYPNKEKIENLLCDRILRNGEKNNFSTVLQSSPPLSNRLSKYYEIGVVLGYYKTTITHCKQILTMIDRAQSA